MLFTSNNTQNTLYNMEVIRFTLYLVVERWALLSWRLSIMRSLPHQT